MDRKLASIQKITAIEPIDNADSIEKVKLLGWQAVSRKGEFRVGDLVCYMEIDSFLPVRPEFEFLRKSCYKKFINGDEGFRIKSIKLRGVLSQGIVFPLSILDGKKYESDTRENPVYDWKEGDDVTALLKVTKYEPIVPLSCSGDAYGFKPAFVPTTDETRIQSSPKLLEEFKGKTIYVSTKIDGTSCSIFWNDNYERNFGVCGRNYELKPGGNAYWQAAKKYNLEEKLKTYSRNIVLQGEVAGPGIQKNPLNLKEVDFFVFDVIFPDEQGRYASLEEMEQVAKDLGLKTVPIDFRAKSDFDYDMDGWLELAKGKYEGTQKNREGIVIRPVIPCHSEELCGRLSAKVINNDYLLKDEE